MKVLAGATRNGLTGTVEYKLITFPNIAIINCTEQNILNILQQELIYGIQIADNKIQTNGDIKRYTPTSIVILAEVTNLSPNHKNKAFICYFNSRLNVYTLDYLANKIKSGTVLANGKLSTNKGTIYIAPIRGCYPTINWGDIHEGLHRQRSSGGAGQNQRTRKAWKETSGGRADDLGHGKSEQRVNRRRPNKAEVLQRLNKVGYNPLVSPGEFLHFIQKAKENNPFGDSVDTHELDEYTSMKCISFDGGLGGVAVEKDGNIVSVFKHPDSNIKGYMRYAMTAAVLNGGTKLDCYSIRGALPTMYSRYGFIPVCKIRFNREFAPPNWNYERDGEPDIVFMVHSGDTLEEMESKIEAGEYKPFQSYDIPYIEDSETECAYDIAAGMRDNYQTNLQKQPIKQEHKGKSAVDIIESLHSKLFKGGK